MPYHIARPRDGVMPEACLWHDDRAAPSVLFAREARMSNQGHSLLCPGPYSAVQPPSTLIVVPVICAAASEHRNSAVPPNCSVVANSFDG